MGKIIAKAWITLDGVFDANSMDQWFNSFHSDARAAEITKHIMDSDAMLYGRTTYEMLMPYWSKLKNNEMGIANQINEVPKYIISASMKTADWNNSTVISTNVIEEIGKLKEKHRQILLDGSASLVQSLVPSGLIDEYHFIVHPVIMGKGKKYFKDGMSVDQLELIKNETLEKGLLSLYYKTLAR
jgi:dihydrofolate reductase